MSTSPTSSPTSLHIDRYTSYGQETPISEDRPLFLTPTPVPQSARAIFPWSSIRRAEEVEVSTSPGWQTTPIARREQKPTFVELRKYLEFIEECPGEVDDVEEVQHWLDAFKAEKGSNNHPELIANVEKKIGSNNIPAAALKV